MQDVLIAEANLEDSVHQEAVFALISSYARDSRGKPVDLPDSVRRNLVSGLRGHPTSLVLLAFQHDRPIGIAVCFFGFSTFAARLTINVHDLVVLEEFRGKGVGSQLLDAVESRAKENGCCKVTLEVLEKNESARELYQRRGFGRAPDDSEAERKIFLEKFLE